MPSPISRKGQVTIPQELRKAMGLSAGCALNFKLEGGRLVATKEQKANPFSRWSGKGKLPKGLNTATYLKLTRDGDGR